MARPTRDAATYPTDAATASTGTPIVRKITTAAVWSALSKGWDDFKAMPTHVIFLGVLYALLGFILVRVSFNYGLLQLAFPLIAGFALIGPFAGIGLYELSRRRERGEEHQWWQMFSVFQSASISALLALGALLTVLLFVWLAVAHWLYIRILGAPPAGIGDFFREMLMTGDGWAVIVLGNLIGAGFALLAFALSVVSFPLLVDRNVGMITAIITSVQAVLANPVPMALWGLVVVAGLVLGSLPFFLGLAIVLPVLGHGTWHLYRRTIA